MSTGLLAEIVGAPDRDDLPGGFGVVSVDEGDEAEFLAEVAERERVRVPLMRRGIDHGTWSELDTSGLAEQVPADIHAWRQRWADARPILLSDALMGSLEAFAPVIAKRKRMGEKLRKMGGGGGLDDLIEAGLERLDAKFDVLTYSEGKPYLAAVGAPLEGELERRFFKCSGLDGLGSDPLAPGFWLKGQELSRSHADESGRVRFGFGVEGADDASHDVARQRATADLAQALLPETALLRENTQLMELLLELDGPDEGGELYLTQDIAYWNAPNGGALMHHDAFDEDYEDRQRAVVYAQLTGATAWLSLSTQDLAARVTEFTEMIHEGELPWVKESLFRGASGETLMRKILRGGRFVFGELERPGCGRLGKLINRGPEFTSLLADAGHGFIARAGDVVILPNHGLGHTAMHSVFCASEETAYSLSLALRREPGPEDADHG